MVPRWEARGREALRGEGPAARRNSPLGAALALDPCRGRSKTQSYSGGLPNSRSKCAQPTRSGNTLPVIAGGSILPSGTTPRKRRWLGGPKVPRGMMHGGVKAKYSRDPGGPRGARPQAPRRARQINRGAARSEFFRRAILSDKSPIRGSSGLAAWQSPRIVYPFPR
ncbi:hypothetical protein KM043_002947 [Ampulex compressa]|nr:hypothetical protein KM043_002947 [Ampulex compressa]